MYRGNIDKDILKMITFSIIHVNGSKTPKSMTTGKKTQVFNRKGIERSNFCGGKRKKNLDKRKE